VEYSELIGYDAARWSIMTDKKLKWAGRNSSKDALRARIWSLLVQHGVADGEVFDKIPGFIGIGQAVERLVASEVWRSARVVKCNPDTAHTLVRQRALAEGKFLYMPVPELVQKQPYLALNPRELAGKGLSWEVLGTKEGAMKYGTPVDFEQMQPLDLVHVGSVAVASEGGRTGKGGGFGDLELGIFRELGIVNSTTPIVTCVHDLQVVPDSELPLQPHDSLLTAIFTTERTILVERSREQPKGVDWESVLPEQYRSIPFLSELRDRLTSRAKA
jgi:5-formyltetrahydrofolate cyclo-ligase